MSFPTKSGFVLPLAGLCILILLITGTAEDTTPSITITLDVNGNGLWTVPLLIKSFNSE